jgi:hypothetical protein
MFKACGGDVVGTWNFAKACVSGGENPLAMQCATSTFQISETVSGTVTFDSKGTYTSSNSFSATEDTTIPASCTGGANCAQLQMSINQTRQGGATTMATCTDAAAGCACHAITTAPNTVASATYSVSGTTITIGGLPSPYCVQGDGLLIQTQTATTGSDILTLALTRQ